MTLPSNLDRHKEIIRQLFEEVWSQADFSRVDQFLAPQFTYHFRGRASTQAPPNLAQIVKRWKEAFPDLRFEVEEAIAEGDLAAARLVYRGTHQGEWQGTPPTGRKVEVREMMFFRFQDGRIVEVWEVTDEHARRQQLAGAE